MRLLADCGNSTIKLALAHEGGIWQQERLTPTLQAIKDFTNPHLDAIAELVMVPGSRAHAEFLRDWWRENGRERPLRVVGEGIAIPELGQYPSCGLDRVLAGLCACIQERHDIIVIDAGTAVTLTVWRYHPAKEDLLAGVRFAGGLILPGSQACSLGLSALAPALPVVEPMGADAAALQQSTTGSLAAALGIGHPAMVSACLEKLRAESKVQDAVITGGNAIPLLGPVLPRMAYRPSLVLEGLEMILKAGK
jgi:pantothenate kinase type III